MAKRKVCNNKSKHYIDKEELRSEMAACKKTGIVSDRLADMFILVTKGVALRFNNLDWYGIMEDVQQDCLLLLIQKFTNYDPERRNKNGQKTSPFAYLTTCVYNHMRYKVSKEKTRKEKTDKMAKKAKEYIDKLERGY